MAGSHSDCTWVSSGRRFVEVLRQGFGSCCIACHGQGQSGFVLDGLAGGNEF
jgi:hypothetical protein